MTVIDADPNASLTAAKPKRAGKPKAQAVAVHQPQPVAAPAVQVSGTLAMLQMIERAGRDPNFDVAKFEKLVEISLTVQRVEDERAAREAELAAEGAFNAAMTIVQAKMKRVAPDSHNSQTKSDYASYAAFDRAVRELYTAAGFALSFNEEDSPKPDHVRVVCYAAHTASEAKRSHTRKYHADLPADGKGAKGGDVMTKTHATGSAFTYGQRYVVKMIFNIAVGVDDDGNAAGDSNAGGVITPEQLAYLEKLVNEVNANVAAACKALKIETLAELPASRFPQAKAKLESMRAPL